MPVFKCGKEGKVKKKKGAKDNSLKLISVTTSLWQKSVLEHCDKRGNDSWARDVRADIVYYQDCFAAECVYHNSCYTNFRSGCKIPQIFQDPSAKGSAAETCQSQSGDDGVRYTAFLQVADYLQNMDADCVTILELTKKMAMYLENSGFQAYGVKHMKSKLFEHFGDELHLVQTPGKADVVSLRTDRVFFVLSTRNKKEKTLLKKKSELSRQQRSSSEVTLNLYQPCGTHTQMPQQSKIIKHFCLIL